MRLCVYAADNVKYSGDLTLTMLLNIGCADDFMYWLGLLSYNTTPSSERHLPVKQLSLPIRCQF
jgi:hypothetical protein